MANFINFKSNLIDQNFEDEHDILTFKPNISFVEPQQIPGAQLPDFDVKEPDTIDDLRARTKDIINQYQAVKKLTEQVKRRIDQRVINSGGVVIKLDPIKDSHIIAAMKREFPNKQDHASIDYETYKECLKKHEVSTPPFITNQDIVDARSNPLRTDFGGFNNQRGENRPEISSLAGGIQPLDLSAFQAAGILAIFLMMLPMIIQQDDLTIAKHLITTPHRPI